MLPSIKRLCSVLGAFALAACASASGAPSDPPEQGGAGGSSGGSSGGSGAAAGGSNTAGSQATGGAQATGGGGAQATGGGGAQATGGGGAQATGGGGAQATGGTQAAGGADPFGGGGSAGDINMGGSGGSAGGCAEETKLIYVLGKGNEFESFDPKTLTLTKIGTLSCPAADGATPFSMSVDRSGTAWVLYNDGTLFHVQIKDASCKATSFVPKQSGFKKFGMGFVSDTPGGAEETLFIANEFGVGKLDTKTLQVTPVGEFGFSAAAELTGTGDAKLFGFFFGFPPYLSEIDKATSKLGKEIPLDTVDTGTGFAFAFWGADFWVFTAPNGTSSQIDRYQPDTNTTSTAKTDLGFKVVGAGVSTCAPTVRPEIN